MILQKFKNYLKENSTLIKSIGGILIMLNITGFNINIVEFYKLLNVESKILFMGLLNFIITIIAVDYSTSKVKIKK